MTKHERRKEFASRLSLMLVEAGQLGLYATMQKIHASVRQVGWEIADTPELYRQDNDEIESIRKS
jgi:hypothetical protein